MLHGTVLSALFPALYSLLFFIISILFFQKYRKLHNTLELCFSLTTLFEAITFLLFAVPALLFPSRSFALTLMTNILGYLVSYIGVAIFAMYNSYLFLKRVPPIYFLLLWMAFGLTLVAFDALTAVPTVIMSNGLVVRNINHYVLLFNNLVVGSAILPAAILFVYQSIHTKYFLKGTLFGVGVFLITAFIPLSLQTKEVGTYIFFNVLTVVGFCALLFVTVFGRTMSAKT